jgi:Domain of unknown function (DUF222)
MESSYLVTASSADDGVSLDELGSRIIGLSGRLAAPTCRWLPLVAQFDARNGCRRFGLGSTAQWLSHACGVSRRTAVEHVRVARGLAAFPALVEAMASVRLSYSHVRAITRLAEPDESHLVADLIEVAEHASVGQLVSEVCSPSAEPGRRGGPLRGKHPRAQTDLRSKHRIAPIVGVHLGARPTSTARGQAFSRSAMNA